MYQGVYEKIVFSIIDVKAIGRSSHFCWDLMLIFWMTFRWLLILKNIYYICT